MQTSRQILTQRAVGCPTRAIITSQALESSTRVRTSFHHGVTYVSYEGNSFSVKFQNTGQYSSWGGCRVR